MSFMNSDFTKTSVASGGPTNWHVYNGDVLAPEPHPLDIVVDRSPADKLDVSILQSQISTLQEENRTLKTEINYLKGFVEGLTESIIKTSQGKR